MSLIMSLPILPPDLITEIISWLPVKILVRFRCVCKHWKSLIFHPTFAKLHLQKSPKHTHTLLALGDINTFDDSEAWFLTPYSVRHFLENPSSTVREDNCSRFKTKNYNAIGSTNGLVCLIGSKFDEDGNRTKFCIRFWNPTLRLRSRKSPTLSAPSGFNLNWLRLGFGYDDSGDTYKVVAVFWDHTVEKWEGRVHCMGDSCWRNTLACPDFPTLLGDTITGPFVNGSVNWLALNNLNYHECEWENVTIEQLVIFSLDMRKETGNYILLPDGIGEKPQEEPALTVLRGFLCLYHDHMKTHFVLWEMREFGVQDSWTRLVNISYVHLQLHDFVPDWRPVCLSENGDVLLLASQEVSGYVIMYNRRDDRVEDIELPNDEIGYAHEHMKSLVLPRPHPHSLSSYAANC